MPVVSAIPEGISVSATAKVESNPFYGERWDLFPALPPSPRAILDVGCGRGLGFLSYARAGVRVVGVDIDTAALEIAAGHIHEALHLDLQTEPWPDRFIGAFDVVAFADCLEHVVDPWQLLRSVRPLLSPTGVVAASIPNVRQVRILAKLALGRWDYVDGAGTVQRPHLRFFTRRTIEDMFGEAGYHRPQFFFPRRTFHLRGPEALVNRLTLGRLADLLYGSHTVSARPKP